jgi:hypothetical protein
VQYFSWLVICRCEALIQSMAMEKVKRVCADGLGAVKDGYGGLDGGAEGPRTDRG